MDYRKYILDKKEKTKYYIISYGFMFLLTYLFYKNIIISVLGGFFSIFFETTYCDYLNKKKKDKLMMQFKDMLYSISSSITIGKSMRLALIDSEKTQLDIYGETGLLYRDLSAMNKVIAEGHISEKNVLVDFATRSGVEDIRNFVDVYINCINTGGNLQKAIAKAIDVIIDKMQVQREIKIMLGQKDVEAKIIGVIPICVILLLNIFSPDYLAVMYISVFGRVIMTIIFATLIGAIYWIFRINDIGM
ncbi:MAG: hypothetical protein PUI85_02630 [Eubacteriales bacterium]|nr:hypothetical protein [Eubacteriales bacterium]MDY3332592.1 hypothetical protein [Gallibacter sp.]